MSSHFDNLHYRYLKLPTPRSLYYLLKSTLDHNYHKAEDLMSFERAVSSQSEGSKPTSLGTFARLPPETRRTIWQLLAGDFPIKILPTGTTRNDVMSSIAILRTSRQINLEAAHEDENYTLCFRSQSRTGDAWTWDTIVGFASYVKRLERFCSARLERTVLCRFKSIRFEIEASNLDVAREYSIRLACICEHVWLGIRYIRNSMAHDSSYRGRKTSVREFTMAFVNIGDRKWSRSDQFIRIGDTIPRFPGKSCLAKILGEPLRVLSTSSSLCRISRRLSWNSLRVSS